MPGTRKVRPQIAAAKDAAADNPDSHTPQLKIVGYKLLMFALNSV